MKKVEAEEVLLSQKKYKSCHLGFGFLREKKLIQSTERRLEENVGDVAKYDSDKENGARLCQDGIRIELKKLFGRENIKIHKEDVSHVNGVV